MLEASSLGKSYPTPRGVLEVLSGVDLKLAPGESAVIMGPSGSGKSTLLYILGGLEPPSYGSVRLGGVDVFALTPAERARLRNTDIGFVFQEHCLLPQCSVLENVLVPTLVASEGDPVAYTQRARALIDRVGLTGRLDHRPAELSGGERQRVAIARALIRQPRLVLCDEPTGNLDGATAEDVRLLLVELHRELQNILVVVTHSTRLAAAFPVRFDLARGRLEAPDGVLP